MTEDEKRAAFANYIATMRKYGWTDADVSEYTAQVRILMGKDDAAALALYPEGLFSSAEEARSEAVKFWRNTK